MKKIIILSMFSLILSGCSSESSSVDSREEKVDEILHQYEGKSSGLEISDEIDGMNYNTSTVGVAQTSDGYFYYMPTESKIVYMSKSTGMAVPVCTKAGCDHFVSNNVVIKEGERYEYSCDAAYPCNVGIQVYNGKLYADMQYMDTEGAHPLMQANVDGTEKTELIHDIEERIKREEEARENELDYVLNSSIKWIIENDIVYIVSVFEMCHHDEQGNTTVGEIEIFVDMYDAKTGEYIGELTHKDLKGQAGIIIWMVSYDNSIGMSLYVEVYDDVTQTYNESRMFYLIDKETGKITTLNPGEVGTYYGNIIVGDKLLFKKNNDNIYSVDSNNIVQECITLEEDEKQSKLSIHYMSGYICTSYSCDLENGEKDYFINLYDKTFNLIENIKVPGNIFVAAACDEQILLKASNVDRFYYINTDELGTGNVELHEFSME